MTCWCWMKLLSLQSGVCGRVRADKALKKTGFLEVIIPYRALSSEALQDQADYITEMIMRRHPYERESEQGRNRNIREYVLAFSGRV